MNNSKLFYFIPVFLLIIFSCQNDDNASNNNSCDGHLEYRINGIFREANCNFNEEGYGSDDIIISGVDYFPEDTSYFYGISANESVGIGEALTMSFILPEPFTELQTITTQYPYLPTMSGEIGIGTISFQNPTEAGFISNNFAIQGSYATLSINEVDGQYISGTFGALIIYDDPIQNDTTTYEITDGIFENVYLEPF